MEQEQLFVHLAKILDVPKDKITGDYTFAFDEWDSLVLMSIAAAIDEVYDVVVSVKELPKCETIGELLNLIEEKKIEDE